MPIFFILFLFLAGCGSNSGSDSASAESGGGGGGGGSVAGSPSSMSVGDAVYADLSSGSGSISFPSSGTFQILLQSHSTGTSTNTVTLSSLSDSGKSLGLGDLDSDLVLQEKLSPQDLLDSTLREEENFSIGAGKSVGGGSVSKAVNGDVNGAISVNSTADFSVLTSLTSTSQCTTITATAKCVNSEVAVYIDNEILTGNAADLPQADIDDLCAVYAAHLPDEKSWFGDTSDIDSNGVVIALITPQVNRLGGSSGVVTGFFNSNDLDAGTCSNQKEAVYLVAPDSAGLYGTKISNSFYMSNFAKGVFFHEVQHLINYYQRVVVKGGLSESSWLNEGLSHLAEDLVGYGRENYSRYNLFLASPQSYSLAGGTSLSHRGAIYLFLRYLYERSGKSKTFLKNMVQTKNSGYTNIVAAYTDPSSDFDSIGEFFKQWGIALAYTDRTSTGSKFQYNARVKNTTTGNWEGACMICTAEDGRGTTLTGPSYGTYSASTSYSVKDGATRFLKLSSNPSSLTLSLPGSNGYGIVLRTE